MRKLSKVSSDSTSKMYPSIDEEEKEEKEEAPSAKEDKLGMMAATRLKFLTFCKETSLHGWRYLADSGSAKLEVLLWTAVVMVSSGLGLRVAFLNTDSFLNSGVTTSIETTTASLNEVFFPAITVCNINQVEASFMKQIGIYHNLSQMRALYNEFISGGHEESEDKEHSHHNILVSWLDNDLEASRPRFVTADTIEWLKDVDLLYDKSITEYTKQDCDHLFLMAKYQDKQLWWHQFVFQKLGPYWFGTDAGSCCFFSPQADMTYFNDTFDDLTDRYHNIKPGARNGDHNGLTILLDAEVFNYAYFPKGAEGFKIAVHDHRNKPIMEHLGLSIHTGTETQIAFKPSITYTTDQAMNRFKPPDGEANLTYFPWKIGYYYDMNNCLLDDAITQVYWECRCSPFFHSWKHYGSNVELPYCSGERLRCMHQKLSSMAVGIDPPEIIMPDAKASPNKMGDLVRPKNLQCFSRCEHQSNEFHVTSSAYPQRDNFMFRQEFCETASHVWQKSCSHPERRHFLTKRNPRLCSSLGDFSHLFDNVSNACQYWPKALFDNAGSLHPSELQVVEDIQKYAEGNLAWVSIMIRHPYVQKIRRGVTTSSTSYVANTGGLLSLCIGSSFVSFLEVFYHCFLKKSGRKND